MLNDLPLQVVKPVEIPYSKDYIILHGLKKGQSSGTKRNVSDSGQTRETDASRNGLACFFFPC